MRDWSRMVNYFSYELWDIKSLVELAKDAITEIERLQYTVNHLRQDKAELHALNRQLRVVIDNQLQYIRERVQEKSDLVNVLKDLIRIRDHFIDKRDFDLLESLPDTWEQAKELIVRHGGAR